MTSTLRKVCCVSSAWDHSILLLSRAGVEMEMGLRWGEGGALLLLGDSCIGEAHVVFLPVLLFQLFRAQNDFCLLTEFLKRSYMTQATICTSKLNMKFFGNLCKNKHVRMHF